MLKIALSSLTLAGLVAALFGATAGSPASALPLIQPQTTVTVAAYHHHYRRDYHHYHHPRVYHHDHHHSGLTIHL
jgi:hypothetical protein